MRVAIVNSSRVYNLAVEKIAQYHRLCGDEVAVSRGIVGKTGEPRQRKHGHRHPGSYDLFGLDAERAYFSAIFTWDLPSLVEQASLANERGVEVEVGGPAVTIMREWVMDRLPWAKLRIGLDDRFESVPGPYKLTFTSRGCPHTCPWCVVPELEGQPNLPPWFVPAPIVGDNNILATPWEHQVRAVETLSQGATIAGVSYPPPRRVDINSGFDARFFAARPNEVYQLYSQLPLLFWRLAFDSMPVEREVEESIRFLRAASPQITHRQVIVYVLYGFNDMPEEALYRAQKVIEWGASPYLMRFLPLNRPDRTFVNVARGWTAELLLRFQLYFNSPHVWRSTRWEEFSVAKHAEMKREVQSFASTPLMESD